MKNLIFIFMPGTILAETFGGINFHVPHGSKSVFLGSLFFYKKPRDPFGCQSFLKKSNRALKISYEFLNS